MVRLKPQSCQSQQITWVDWVYAGMIGLVCLSVTVRVYQHYASPLSLLLTGLYLLSGGLLFQWLARRRNPGGVNPDGIRDSDLVTTPGGWLSCRSPFTLTLLYFLLSAGPFIYLVDMLDARALTG